MTRARNSNLQRWQDLLPALPGIIWLVLFVLVPAAVLCAASFWESDLYGLQMIWTTRHWERLFESPLYLGLLLKTLRISLGTTLLSLVASFPIALYLTRLSGRAKAAVVLALFLPFWVGFIVRTFAWLPILGRNGLINEALEAFGIVDEAIDWLLYNEGTVYLGLINGYLLFMILPIYLSLDKIDSSIREAAEDLRASPYAVFRHILLPLSIPGVISGCVMVFLLSFGAYVTPALLGGPSGIMFSNVIAQQFTADNNWAFGSALSVLMTMVVLLTFYFVGRKYGLQRIFSATKGG